MVCSVFWYSRDYLNCVNTRVSAWRFETAHRSSKFVVSKDTCRQSAETRFDETTSRTSCARPLRDVAWPAWPVRLAWRSRNVLPASWTKAWRVHGCSKSRGSSDLCISWVASRLSDDIRLQWLKRDHRDFGVDKTWKNSKTNWTFLGRSLRAFSTFYKMTLTTWRSSFDHPDPHGIQLNALKDMTLGYIWIHLADLGSLVLFPLFICLGFYVMVDPKDFGLARWKSWASLRHHGTLSIAANSTCERSGDDNMIHMKWNEVMLQTFAICFAWVLLEILKRKDDLTISSISWCFGVSLLGAEGCHQRLFLGWLF